MSYWRLPKPLCCSVVLLLPLLLAGPSPALLAAERPNIVMIISDDQAWSDYGFMGHPSIQTPHLDRLASESVLFRRGYVPTALCRPSLMTLVTGHYAHRHGVTGNDPSPKYASKGSEKYKAQRAQLISFIDGFRTLPEQLADLGYLSHQSGKWWEGHYSRGGFTHGMTRGFPQPGGRHGDDGLTIGRKGMEPVLQFVDQAVEKEQPFFVWYAPFLPHTPHTPPADLLAKYSSPETPQSIAKYHAMCEWFDQTCGELLDHIDEKGLRDNTLVVYVTDNGWIQKPDGNGYAPRSKQTAYEGGIRTPIMFRWPKRWQAADRDELVSSIDIVPTLLAAAGIQPDQELPGLNLLTHLDEQSVLPREQIFGEGFAHDIASINQPEASLLYRWCIKNQWKLLLTYDGEVNRYQSTHPRTESGPQLFDLRSDPWEKQNVASANPEIVAELASEIEGWYPLKNRKTSLTIAPTTR